MLTTCLFNGQEGQVNTALMMRTLYNYAGMLQIKMLSGAEVEHLEEFADYTEVHLKEPISKGVIKLHAKKIAVCTNAFTAKFFPEIDITPGRGQVLCTKPIEGLKVKGVFSFDEGYYYFRNFESRIILGGGRNLDFEEETTTDFGITQKIQQQLEFYLEEMIVPGKTVHIDSRWSGIMAFGKDKQPLLKKMGNSLFLAARLNGMGIALGSKIGDDISTMMLED
jgi:glycine/D-amino acid oxidase-like deaminating enzyme